MAARKRTDADARSLGQLLESSPALFKEVLDTAAQGLVAVDRAGRIVLANEAASIMFGYSRAALLRLHLGALIPEGMRRIHSKHVRDFFQAPRRRPMGQGFELEGRRKDGTRFPIEVALSMVEVHGTPVAVAFVSDITRRKAIDAEMKRYRDQLSQLTRRMVSATEEASRAWARELHDVFSQRLAALSMQLSYTAAEESKSAESIASEVRRLAEQIHQMSRRMHPGILHDLGLVAALRGELAVFQRETGVETSVDSRGQVAGIPGDVALCLYRIAQESLHNIRKHSGARKVDIRLRKTRSVIVFEVEDEGDGFDLQEAAGRGGLGLISMGERARAVGGEFQIESTVGAGTIVRVEVPVEVTGRT